MLTKHKPVDSVDSNVYIEAPLEQYGYDSMLREKLNSTLELAQAVKDGCTEHTLKLILTAIRDQDIAAKESGLENGLPDIDIIKILKTMIDQRRSAILDHEQAGKVDLVERENREIAVITQFMPTICADAEAVDVCRAIINDTGATGIKDIGKTVDELRARMGDRLDFGRAKSIARTLLT